MRLIPSLLVLLTLSAQAFGQNQLGFAWSSFGGVHTALANPASLGFSHLRTQVCISGGDVGLSTNFLKIKSGNGGAQFLKVLRFGPDLVDAVNGDGSQEPGQLLEDNFARNRFAIVLNGKSKNLNLSTEYRGPAVMFAFNRGGGALYYRARAAFQVRDMAEPLARLIYPGIRDADESQYNRNLPDNRFNLGANLFHEFGASAGLRVLSIDNHHFSAGAGVRYVMGLYSMDISNRGLSLTVRNEDTLLAIQSDVRYRYTDGNYLSRSDKVIPDALGRGFGLDLGAMYELQSDGLDGPGTPGISKHKFRAAASVVDMGAVFYSNKNWVRASKLGRTNTAVILGGYDTLRVYDEKDLDSTFRRVFGLDNFTTRFTTYMPVALQLSADLNLMGPLFVSVQAIQSLRTKATPGMRRFSTYVLAPRFEKGIFEASLPVGLGMGGGVFQAGFFLRVSGFYIGSDNFLPVAGLAGRGLNFYLGGYIPVRKKLL